MQVGYINYGYAWLCIDYEASFTKPQEMRINDTLPTILFIV